MLSPPIPEPVNSGAEGLNDFSVTAARLQCTHAFHRRKMIFPVRRPNYGSDSHLADNRSHSGACHPRVPWQVNVTYRVQTRSSVQCFTWCVRRCLRLASHLLISIIKLHFPTGTAFQRTEPSQHSGKVRSRAASVAGSGILVPEEAGCRR
jgi:hypothetical protein